MIIPWIFKHLPGSRWVRILLFLLGILLLIYVLFEWVFPLLDGWLSEPVVQNSKAMEFGSNLVIGEGA